MKIDISSDAGWTIFGVLFLVMVISAIVGGYSYNKHKNELLLKADSCEKLVIIDGGYADKLAICQIKK